MQRTAVLASNPPDAATHDVDTRLRARSRAIGVLFFAGFGALWAVGGAALSSAPAWAWLLIAVIGVAFGVRALALLRANPAVAGPLPAAVEARRRHVGRVFLWTNALQWIAIVVAVNGLVRLGHAAWQMPAVMAIVGLHFLPLAAAFRYRPHVASGVAMVAWALTYPWLFAAGSLAPAGPFGAAAILFASAARALWSVRAAAR